MSPLLPFVQGLAEHNQKASKSERSLAKGQTAGKDKYQPKNARYIAFMKLVVPKNNL